MADPSASTDALMKWYGAVKSIAQTISYLGLIATAGLSVFDYLHEQKEKEAGENFRLRLNRAGRTHLAAFLTISVLTISATFIKDYADHKLDAMATAKARADLQEILGGDFKSFADKNLKPSVDKLSDAIEEDRAKLTDNLQKEQTAITGNIQDERTALNSNIASVAERLNGAVNDSKAIVEKSMLETAAEAEAANARIQSFTIAFEMAGVKRMADPYQNFQRLKDWEVTQKAVCPQVLSRDDTAVWRNCMKLLEGTRQLMIVSNLVRIVDPSDSGLVIVNIKLRSFAIEIDVPRSCRADPGPRTYNVNYDRCILINDEPKGLNGSRSASLLQSGGPGLAVIDSGFKWNNEFGTVIPIPFMEELYGRDADLTSISISGPDIDKRSADIPKVLQVSETLNATGDTPLTRTYELKFSGFSNEACFDGSCHPSANYLRIR
jgi:hypothetical protein